MNTNEITIAPVKASAIAKTGNERLDKLSAEITKQMDKASSLYTEVKAKTEAYARACAPLFGEIKRDKLYEKGGFKSLEEYAAQFGIQKSTAYMWARVGEKFFLEDNDYTRRIRETLSVANMAELVNSDRVAAAKAIDDGKLDKDTAQQAVREFAAAHKLPGKGGKEKVVQTFTVSRMFPDMEPVVIAENAIKEDCYESVAKSLVDGCYVESEAAVMFSTVKFDGDKGGKAHFIAYTAAGFVSMYELNPYHKKHDSKEDKRAWAANDIKAMLKGMSHKERLAFLESLADAPEGEDDAE
jgi:hypothetical protein